MHFLDELLSDLGLCQDIQGNVFFVVDLFEAVVGLDDQGCELAEYGKTNSESINNKLNKTDRLAFDCQLLLEHNRNDSWEVETTKA